MPSNEAVTLMQMIESLPESKQERVLEHVREYVTDVLEDARWDALLAETQPGLAAAAREAKRQIAAGQAEPLDERRL